MHEHESTGDAFHWNGPVWFGSSIGGSAWLLIIGVIACWQESSIVGVTALASFAIVVAFAVTLWNRRSQWDIFAAILTLIAVIGFCTTTVFAAIHLFADRDLQLKLQWNHWAWLVLLIFPAIALQLTWIRKQFQAKT